jgi:predicted dehydrogenase
LTLTPEQQTVGRRNFLKAVAGLPALAGLGVAAAARGPVAGGPVRLGFIGVGGEGRVLLAQVDPAFATVTALCDINPAQLSKADEVLAKTGRPAAPHFADFTQMLAAADVEAVVIATPLWMHAEHTVRCLDAGRHVLCEKMMAWDLEGCERMRDTARRTGRVLEIGYQRFYNPIYQAAYEGIIRAGTLGDIYTARIAWHRNGNWRRQGDPPSPSYDPSPWGYKDWEHLLNWRLYNQYSRGLLAELASHQVNVVNWFFGAVPEAVHGSGGVYRWKDGREVDDHVFATFEYPGGRTATFSSIESNAFDHFYEAFFGTKGTLMLRGETEAYLFEEGGGARPTGIEVATPGAGPVLEASESRAADAAGRNAGGGAATSSGGDRLVSYRNQISGFCSAIRTGVPLRCGPDKAVGSAAACLRAFDAIAQKTRLAVAPADRT